MSQQLAAPTAEVVVAVTNAAVELCFGNEMADTDLLQLPCPCSSRLVTPLTEATACEQWFFGGGVFDASLNGPVL